MTESIQRAARAIRLRNARRIQPGFTEADLQPLDEMAPGIAAMYEEQATACLETLLDPSEEAVRAAAHALAETDGMPGTYDDMALACIRAYHMTILGRDK